MLQSLNRLSGSSLDSLQYVHICLVLGSPELNTVLQVWPHQCWVEGKAPLPRPAGHTLPNAAQETTSHLAARAHCWLMFNLVPTRTLKSCSTKLLSSWSASSIASFRKQCCLNLETESPSFPLAEFHLVPSERLWWMTQDSLWMLCLRVAHAITDRP